MKFCYHRGEKSRFNISCVKEVSGNISLLNLGLYFVCLKYCLYKFAISFFHVSMIYLIKKETNDSPKTLFDSISHDCSSEDYSSKSFLTLSTQAYNQSIPVILCLSLIFFAKELITYS